MDEVELAGARAYIYEVARFFTKNRDDAEDCAQEAMLLLISRPRYGGDFKPLLKRLTKLAYYSFIRKQHRRIKGQWVEKCSSFDRIVAETESHGGSNELPDIRKLGKPLWSLKEGQDPEASVLVNELLDLILHQVDVTNDERTIMLALAMGYECRECAKVMGIHEDTVSKWNSRARKKAQALRNAYSAA